MERRQFLVWLLEGGVAATTAESLLILFLRWLGENHDNTPENNRYFHQALDMFFDESLNYSLTALQNTAVAFFDHFHTPAQQLPSSVKNLGIVMNYSYSSYIIAAIEKDQPLPSDIKYRSTKLPSNISFQKIGEAVNKIAFIENPNTLADIEMTVVYQSLSLKPNEIPTDVKNWFTIQSDQTAMLLRTKTMKIVRQIGNSPIHRVRSFTDGLAYTSPSSNFSLLRQKVDSIDEPNNLTVQTINDSISSPPLVIPRDRLLQMYQASINLYDTQEKKR